MSLSRTAALAAFLLGCGVDHPELGLEPAGSYLTGVHPVTAVVADLDGDGDDDLAVPGLVTPELVVLENQAGSIRWHPPIELLDGATEMIAADFDGDGRVELAASHREIEQVAIYGVTADFELEVVEQIELDGLVTALASLDLDGDGDPDLAVSRFAGASVELFFNDAGQLSPAASIETGHGPFAIRAADLDGDAAPELAVLGAGSDRVEVFSGADARWRLQWSVDTDAWPSSLEVADLDGDGAPELIGTATIGDRLFAVDIDAGAGHYQVLGAGDGAFGVKAVDIAGDLGLAVSNKDAGTVSVFSPGLETPRLTFDLGAGTGPSPVYRWDLDGDGAPELLAVVCAFVDQVSILRWRP